jgi:hypothetical protein
LKLPVIACLALSTLGNGDRPVAIVTFQQAYDAVDSTDLWTSLTPPELTRLIYQEMRRLDAEHIARTKTPEKATRC